MFKSEFHYTTDLNILKQRLNGHKSVYYKNTAAGYMKQAKISGILGVSFSALSGILMTYAISADIDTNWINNYGMHYHGFAVDLLLPPLLLTSMVI